MESIVRLTVVQCPITGSRRSFRVGLSVIQTKQQRDIFYQLRLLLSHVVAYYGLESRMSRCLRLHDEAMSEWHFKIIATSIHTYSRKNLLGKWRIAEWHQKECVGSTSFLLAYLEFLFAPLSHLTMAATLISVVFNRSVFKPVLEQPSHDNIEPP